MFMTRMHYIKIEDNATPNVLCYALQHTFFIGEKIVGLKAKEIVGFKHYSLYPLILITMFLNRSVDLTPKYQRHSI